MELMDQSIAGAAFDDAMKLVESGSPVDPRARVPFDYDPVGRPMVQRWTAPGDWSSLPDVGSIVETARAMRRGEISALELVERSLAAAEESTALGGLVEVSGRALDEARALDAELATGHDRGPLHGIPITVKDVIDVEGLATRAGSEAYFDRPTIDAFSVRSLRDAGAVVVGKAATHEFALGVTTPQCRHPLDVTRIPGGSSGGSAICVVTGVGLGSLGTDTRASIRVPAALNGVVGFKPTYGKIPTDGVVALSWTMDHVAPLASTVSDAALMLDVLFGAASALLATPTTGLSGMRIGVPSAGFDGAEPGVVAAVTNALDGLAELGALLQPSVAPSAEDFAEAGALGLVVSRCEAATMHRGLGLDRNRYWKEVGEQLDHADEISAVSYLEAQRRRGDQFRRLSELFEEYDLLAMPTVPVVAPRVEEFADYLMILARNAIPWSLVGFPAISVPVGTSTGLPVGLQLVAPPGREALLVEVGRAVESLVS